MAALLVASDERGARVMKCLFISKVSFPAKAQFHHNQKPLTKILHILIQGEVHGNSLLRLPRASASPITFVDDNAISSGSRDEGCAVGELGPSAVEVEGDVGQAVPQDTQEESDVSGEPGKLERLGQCHESLGQRHVCRWRWGHDNLRL